MIQEFVDKFMDAKNSLFTTEHPGSYHEIVQTVVEILADEDEYGDSPDPTRIHQIDDGDYQGTLIFVIAANGYQPSNYWYTRVSYGSCSGCDTLQGIGNYSDDPPTEYQAKEYQTLALHLVQRMSKMEGGW